MTESEMACPKCEGPMLEKGIYMVCAHGCGYHYERPVRIKPMGELKDELEQLQSKHTNLETWARSAAEFLGEVKDKAKEYEDIKKEAEELLEEYYE